MPTTSLITDEKAVNVMYNAIRTADLQYAVTAAAAAAAAAGGEVQDNTAGGVYRGQGHVVLLATGCLTNVAVLLTVYPEVVQHLQAIVIMGGGIQGGNITPG